jgi:hypothetical protein
MRLTRIIEEEIPKLSFSDSKNFKFLAAFKKYSEFFDQVSNEDKISLNTSISKLYNDEITYPEFYNGITKISGEPAQRHRFRRTSIKGQRKQSYRQNEQKKQRMDRHKR